MAISLKLQHMKRYRDIAWLLMKYGRSDLVQKAGLGDALEDENPLPKDGEKAAEAHELAKDLEALGPTFIKLGQLLSTRPDILPVAYIEALSRLQDNVEPFPLTDVERIVVEELGVRLSKAFSSFDPKPIGAASLGQVHRAALRDGREVVVKIQRPNIRQQIAEDLEAIEEIAGFLDKHTAMGRSYEFSKMVGEFRKSLMRELDYRLEAQNLTLLGKNLAEFEAIVVPAPIDDYTTSRVLTMDYINGHKLTALSPLERIDLDGAHLAEQLFRAYLKQILVDGFFHADPHPGNVFVTSDHRIALLDLGMTARIAPQMQEKLLKLLLAVSEGRAEESARIAIEIGSPRADFDREEFTRHVSELVSQHQNVKIEDIDVGMLVLQVARAGGDSGMRLPSELTMLGKTLLNLDQVGQSLDPQFDVNASVRRNAAEILRQRMLKSVSPANILGGVLEMKEFMGSLPGRAGRILDALANNELAVKVQTIDEKRLIDGFQKVANRITLGLVLAAMIVAGALMMRVETSFRIVGYPGIAMLLFLGATAGGVALVVSILAHDEKPDR